MNTFRKSIFAATAVFAILTNGPALGNVKVTRLDDKGRWADIEISGEITAKDATRFADLVRLLHPKIEILTVQLSSPGGDVASSLKIGDIIRSNWLYTEVSDGSDGSPSAECDSACVLLFAAGAVRMAGNGSKIGIHRPYFDQRLFAGLRPEDARTKYDALSHEVQAYLAKMGMAQELFLEMMKVPSNEIRTLTLAELERFSLVGQDPGLDEYNRAKNVTKYGADAMRAWDAWKARSDRYATACGATGKSFEDCIREFNRNNPDPLVGK